MFVGLSGASERHDPPEDPARRLGQPPRIEVSGCRSRASTGATQADQIETVANRRERRFACKHVEGPIQSALERGRDEEILDLAAS
jgi:hypothetical protein